MNKVVLELLPGYPKAGQFRVETEPKPEPEVKKPIGFQKLVWTHSYICDTCGKRLRMIRGLSLYEKKCRSYNSKLQKQCEGLLWEVKQ
jgi:hypothetical protein